MLQISRYGESILSINMHVVSCKWNSSTIDMIMFYSYRMTFVYSIKFAILIGYVRINRTFSDRLCTSFGIIRMTHTKLTLNDW